MTIKINKNEIPSTVVEAKRWWRKQIKQGLSEITDYYMYEVSETTWKKIIRMPEYKAAKTVMIYASAGKEVMTQTMLTSALRKGKRVCLPKCTDFDENGKRIPGMVPTMEARVFDSEHKLSIGAFGIAEPSEDAPVVDPSEIDFIVLPCMTCDKDCRRLGHGAGYYDRFLERTRPDCMKVAVCYGELLADELPVDEYDVPMDAVVTEREVYYRK